MASRSPTPPTAGPSVLPAPWSPPPTAARLGATERPDVADADQRGQPWSDASGRWGPPARSWPRPTVARAGPAQSAPSGQDLFSVTFADASHGWAVGDRRHHPGHHRRWCRLDRSERRRPRRYLNGVACQGATRAWAVGEKGVILATSDGGAHWLVRRAAHAHAPDLYTVDFASRSHGWAVGVGGHDPGDDRLRPDVARASSPSNRVFTSVDFVDTLHGFVTEITGAVLTTTTAGWSDRLPPTVSAAGVAGWHGRTVHGAAASGRRAGFGRGDGAVFVRPPQDLDDGCRVRGRHAGRSQQRRQPRVLGARR